MKTFLYFLTSFRSGAKDKAVIIGGTHYYHEHLLMVIEAIDAQQAARALNTKIVDTFDRSGVHCPTIYYTSEYFGNRKAPPDHPEGYFYLSLREIEPSDEISHPDLKEKIRLKVTAPQQT